jgi:DNA-binding NarL/FixJ family response regulator
LSIVALVALPVRELGQDRGGREHDVYAALRAGASGFLLKDASAHQLISGVRSVASGEALLAPSITKRLIEEFTATLPATEPPGLSDLTAREREVLRLVARWLSNQEIAPSCTSVRTRSRRASPGS